MLVLTAFLARLVNPALLVCLVWMVATVPTVFPVFPVNLAHPALLVSLVPRVTRVVSVSPLLDVLVRRVKRVTPANPVLPVALDSLDLLAQKVAKVIVVTPVCLAHLAHPETRVRLAPPASDIPDPRVTLEITVNWVNPDHLVPYRAPVQRVPSWDREASQAQKERRVNLARPVPVDSPVVTANLDDLEISESRARRVCLDPPDPEARRVCKACPAPSV